MLVVLVTIVVGLALARSASPGWSCRACMAVAFRRARTFLRRITQRRQTPRPDSPDRRTWSAGRTDPRAGRRMS